MLFEDQFTTISVDRDGKKFDRVSRIEASSSNHNMELSLDIHSELYPLRPGQGFTLALASSLTPEGEKESGVDTQSWRLDQSKPTQAGGSGSLADDFEYVMYGKLYKFDSGASSTVTAYISFGGLLLALTGDFRHLDQLTVGQMVFLLMRQY